MISFLFPLFFNQPESLFPGRKDRKQSAECSWSAKMQKPQKRACLFPQTVLYFLLFAEAGGYLGVAQLGSVLEWGSRGREFKSLHPDQKSPEIIEVSGLLLFLDNGIKW